MAKNIKSAIKAAAMQGPISTSVSLESVAVDEAGKPVDVLVMTVTRGTLPPETVNAFQGVCGGVFGAVAKGAKAAIVSALTAAGLDPAEYALPASVKFAEAGDNAPKEAEEFADLSPEEQGEMSAKMSDFKAEVSVYRDATVKTRQATLTVARKLNEIREGFVSKKRFGIFIKLAAAESVKAKAEGWPNVSDVAAVAEILTAKNTPAEFLFFGKLPDSLLELMPEAKNSPKAAQAWVNGMRSALAADLVDLVKGAEGGHDESLTEAVQAAFVEMESALMDDATRHLFGLHVANLDGLKAFFDMDVGGKLTPARAEKVHVTKSLFGTEGSDELVSALCGALNGYKTEAEKDEAKATAAKAKAIAAVDFNALPVADVALHLFRIIAGRVDETTEEALAASVDGCQAIVAALGDIVELLASGSATLDDIINPKIDVPEGEGAAEDDADTAA